MHALTVNAVLLLSICACTYELPSLMEALLSSLTVFINSFVLHLYVCTVCLCMICNSVYLPMLLQKPFLRRSKVLRPWKLQAQVEETESVSAEKDAEYKLIVEKSEGEVI